MSWEDNKEEPKEEPKAEDPKVEEPKVEAAKEPEKQPEPVKVEPQEKPEQKMVPEALVGKVAKAIREKSRAEMTVASDRISQLEEENRRLREMATAEPAETDVKREEIAAEVQRAFLKRQDLYGRQKYGQAYDDALVVVNAQNDPVLFRKIQGAVNPADTLMQEAAKIAEDVQHANDPGWKEREIEARVRKQVEAEVAAKIKARGNQPTDVQSVRAAGGEVRPERKAASWGTTLPR